MKVILVKIDNKWKPYKLVGTLAVPFFDCKHKWKFFCGGSGLGGTWETLECSKCHHLKTIKGQKGEKDKK